MTNDFLKLNYTCGCVWRFVNIPYEHWIPSYCNDHENILEIKSTLKEMDDKLDKLTIITCKQSESSLCS